LREEPIENNKIDELMMKVSISLIEHSDFQKLRSVIKYFGGVMGYDYGKSCWKQPKIYTPFLAAIQFCIRVFGLEASLPKKYRSEYVHGEGSTPLARFKDYHSQWLVVGEANPLSWTHKLMVYGLHIARGSPSNDRVKFSTDQSYCYIDGYGFLIKEWKAMVRDVIRNMEWILSRKLLFLEKSGR
jgi:hypothetical protein